MIRTECRYTGFSYDISISPGPQTWSLTFKYGMDWGSLDISDSYTNHNLSCLPTFVAVLLQSSLPYTDFLHVFSLLDRVVDDLNPMLNFTRKEVENLLHFVEKEPAPQASLNIKGIKEPVLQLACLKYPHLITKVRGRDACSSQYSSLHSGKLVWQTTFLPLKLCFIQKTWTHLVLSLPCEVSHPSLILTVLSSAMWNNLSSVSFS